MIDVSKGKQIVHFDSRGFFKYENNYVFKFIIRQLITNLALNVQIFFSINILRRCGIIANETISHRTPNDMEINNYMLPYGQVFTNPFYHFWTRLAYQIIILVPLITFNTSGSMPLLVHFSSLRVSLTQYSALRC